MKTIVCTSCPVGCRMTVVLKDGEVLDVKGNTCPKGREYAVNECLHPVRQLTTTVTVAGEERLLPVRSKKPLPKEMLFMAMREINKHKVNLPVHMGDVLIHNILNSGVDIVFSKSLTV